MNKRAFLLIFIFCMPIAYSAVPVIINTANSINDGSVIGVTASQNALLNISTDIRADVLYTLNNSPNITVYLNRTDGYVSVANSIDGINRIVVYAYNPVSYSEVSTLTLTYRADLILPVVTIQKNTSSLLIGNSIRIRWNASDDYLSFYRINVTAPNGNLLAQSTDFSDIVIQNLTYTGAYIINAYANDTAGNSKSELSSFDVGNPGLTVNLKNPGNSELLNDDDVTVYCNVSDGSALSKIAFYTNFSGRWDRESETSFANANFTENNLRNGVYKWSCKALDTYGGESWAPDNYTFIVDDIAPLVGINYPADNYASENSHVAFNLTASDEVDVEVTCNLTINSEVRKKNFGIFNKTSVRYNITGFSNGNYSWYFECADDAGNYAKSSTYKFEVNVLPETPAGTTEIVAVTSEPSDTITENNNKESTGENKEKSNEENVLESAKTEDLKAKSDVENQEESKVKTVTTSVVREINRTSPIYVLAIFIVLSVLMLGGLSLYFYSKDNVFAKIWARKWKNKIIDGTDYLKYKYRHWRNRPY